VAKDTAQNAIDAAPRADNGDIAEYTTKFVCPYSSCKVYAVQHWGKVQVVKKRLGGTSSSRNYSGQPIIEVARCEACERESIFVNATLTFPEESEAPDAARDLPDELKEDFEEARSIYRLSPRGAAALLRLVLQKLLPILGATKSDINAGIEELVAAGKIKSQIQQALDVVRVVGNESVHPGQMDIRDDRETAIALFRIINLVVETEITEPKRLAALYESLPQSKLDGIVDRDSKAATGKTESA